MSAHEIRLGAGAGYAGDRIAPAVELASTPSLDYLIFECLAERTIALAQRDREQNPNQGYNPLLDERMRRVLPACVQNDITIVTNMGAANPPAAAARTREIAAELDVDVTVAAVSGCDVLEQFDAFADETLDGAPVADYQTDAVSASAYLDVSGIVTALDQAADVVITGRVADTSLFLAPAIHEFEWQLAPLDRPDLIGQGIVTAHLCECAGQVTGGYYADPGYKDVPDLATLGFPIAELTEDGSLVITKPADTGGMVSEQTCKEQLLYEIHDPSAYVTPDAIADFTGVTLTETSEDRVAVSGATADPRPETLRVNIGYEDGIVGEGAISYAGPGAVPRAELAADIIETRLAARDESFTDIQIDLMGVDSLHGSLGRDRGPDPYEVRLRVAARTDSQPAAQRVGREVERLYTNGPAGGGGVTRTIEPKIGIVSTLIDRDRVSPTVSMGAA